MALHLRESQYSWQVWYRTWMAYYNRRTKQNTREKQHPANSSPCPYDSEIQGISNGNNDHNTKTYLLALSKPEKRERGETLLVGYFIHQEERVIRQQFLPFIWEFSLPKLSLSPSPWSHLPHSFQLLRLWTPWVNGRGAQCLWALETPSVLLLPPGCCTCSRPWPPGHRREPEPIGGQTKVNTHGNFQTQTVEFMPGSQKQNPQMIIFDKCLL